MTIEIKKVRPAVITKGTYDHLNNYLAFRHVVRNVYTFNLSITKLQVLIDDLIITFSEFKQDIGVFCAFITE